MNPDSKPVRKTYQEFISHLNFRYVRTNRRGCRIYKTRSSLGQRKVWFAWTKKYPYLFTKDCLRRFAAKRMTRQ